MNPLVPTLTLYQPVSLASYTERLICGFTGKPLTLGGLSFPREEILENRRSLCVELGLNSEKLVVPDQTHSANIRHHTDSTFAQTDAVILTKPDNPAMVVVADCVPVILYDPQHHVAALTHAGWRGSAQAITAKTVARMQADCKTDPSQLLAVIGPAIGGCCYEVSEEVADAVKLSLSGHNPAAFIQLNSAGKPQIDLKTVNRLQLEACGVGSVEIVPDCTRCQPERLWSYRRGEAGRQAAYLQLL